MHRHRPFLPLFLTHLLQTWLNLQVPSGRRESAGCFADWPDPLGDSVLKCGHGLPEAVNLPLNATFDPD